MSEAVKQLLLRFEAAGWNWRRALSLCAITPKTKRQAEKVLWTFERQRRALHSARRSRRYKGEPMPLGHTSKDPGGVANAESFEMFCCVGGEHYRETQNPKPKNHRSK